MEKNQNDKRNQQSGSKSQLEKFEDGTKKKETNPSNPTAKKDHQPGSQQGNYQEKSPTSTQNKSNSNVQDSDEREEALDR